MKEVLISVALFGRCRLLRISSAVSPLAPDWAKARTTSAESGLIKRFSVISSMASYESEL